MTEYQEKIIKMSVQELRSETKDKIGESSFWSRENHESHSQVDACYAEWVKREGDDSTYKRLHQEVRKEYT
ncbi:hypothetical protein [Sporosarcina sp. FSL W7-1283]|uniref:hypothetical protein n=1 Tax=Sporosarcina sp. FSL W7-1283 TaxID=2921560 RepID=UPI0030F8208E